ncbi:peptidase M20 family protein [Agromyces sp. Root81]|uniref:M20/M25/M40 family metallo-hydrolase n=1 Tax=Agromyces sp. Root81 TaxID=1736601 RepID=UPI0007019512|nr:M20/M25/M40 family metallo-hydrolase [Agromyces sp. Root81]KRC61390.1 peptidase M20 family protein [Agromyces sp. Root81]
MTPAEVEAAVDAAWHSVPGRVQQLVAIETPSFDAAASARIAQVLAGWFEPLASELRTVVTDAGTHLVIEVPGTSDDAPIMLLGHSDTVWDHGTLQSTVPWSVDGDVVRGPGVFDMKSGLVTMLTALEILQDRPRRPVRILITCDEEVGSPTSQDLVRSELAGVAGVIGFESPHPDGAFKVGRAGSTRVRLDIEGRAAHAALDPGNGVSAIDELVDQLLVVRELVAEASAISPVLCNVGTVSGGARANVVPDSASAEIGLRFVDGEAERHVLGALARLAPMRAGAVVRATILTSRPAWQAGAGDVALLDEVGRAASALGQSADGRPAAGAGDTNLVGSLGVPTIDGFGPRGGGAHAVTEHMLLSSLRERIELLTAVLAR